MTKTSILGKGRLSLLLCLTGLLCLAAPRVRADDGDQGDPPTRVARISFTDGTVSIQPGGQGDWGAASLNRPMTVGDKVWSDKDSRAELQTGVASIHVGSMTALSFLNLDQNIMQLRLPEGSINFRIREIREGDTFEVDTPNLAFNITQAGAFRIDVNENGDSTGITVIRGEGQVTASGQTYTIHAGERGVFNGTDDVQSSVNQAPAPDRLDQWANERDLREQDSVSSRYVPPDTPGTEDLDNNGTWSEEPEVGNVWYPNDVGPDWAPYSNGYWAYVGPWGWTWVDYAPWGFAPFHYGRWGFWGGRWGWCPGPVIYPAVYGPAFVGFLGGGFGFGVGIGVGWFPLGWGEPFHPWFHCGPGFEERINVRNTFFRGGFVAERARTFNNFTYAHNVRAVTATSRSAFTGGERINRGAFHMTEASLRNAQVTNRANFSPSRQSAFGASNLRGNISKPSRSIENRPVLARTAPSRAASNMHTRTMDTRNLSAGRFGTGSPDRAAGVSSSNTRMSNGNLNNDAGSRNANNSRAWNAQGNVTDRGRAPQGFGSEARPGNEANLSSRPNRTDRPPWAGSGPSNSNVRGANNNYGGSANPSNNRSVYSNNGRAYNPPERNMPSNNRTYSQPSQPRTYSAPSRSYSPPTRSYPAPSRSYSSGGGGGSSRGGGGGGSAPRSSGGGGSAPHGGGGGSSSHGGGGGGRPHR